MKSGKKKDWLENDEKLQAIPRPRSVGTNKHLRGKGRSWETARPRLNSCSRNRTTQTDRTINAIFHNNINRLSKSSRFEKTTIGFDLSTRSRALSWDFRQPSSVNAIVQCENHKSFSRLLCRARGTCRRLRSTIESRDVRNYFRKTLLSLYFSLDPNR
jgi:hypothetical protein